MTGALWKVTGTGGGAGGILVREGRDVDSREAPGGRLATGSVLAELELHGERLRFTRISGSGPAHGWIGTHARGTPIVASATGDADTEDVCQKALVADGKKGLTLWLLGQGTRGDVQPLVVLGQTLMHRGHNVKVFASGNFRGFVESYGLPFVDQGVDIQKASKEEEGKMTTEKSEWEQKMKTDKESMGQDLINNILTEERYADMARVLATELEKGERPDLVVFANLIALIPLYAWRRYGIPCMHVNYFPVWLNTAEALRETTWAESVRIDKAVETATGFGALDGISFEEFHEFYTSPLRCMTAHSPELLVLMRGEFAEIGASGKDLFTGFWIIDDAAQMQDLDAFGGIEGLRMMQRFFDSGKPPIYIGWGSMPIGVGALAKALIAVKEAGQRALVVGGWMGSGLLGLEEFVEDKLPGDPLGIVEFARKNVLFVKSAPHGWLFQRCSATVHHGGAGTTAAALLAGVPTIITPFSFDQQHHADWVERLGCGVQLSLLAGSGLIDPVWIQGFKKATKDRKLRARAREMADIIRQERGVLEAVDRIESAAKAHAERPAGQNERPKLGF